MKTRDNAVTAFTESVSRRCAFVPPTGEEELTVEAIVMVTPPLQVAAAGGVCEDKRLFNRRVLLKGLDGQR
jgi:hypothetical protein